MMVTAKFLSVILVFTTRAVASAAETDLFALLLKRQDPGTPAYNCHDNCGTAITQSKQPSPCSSNAFKTNYNNCLQCAGSDNYNIWRYYGNTLSSAAAACGLGTQPKSGKQPEVGPAVHSGGLSSATPSAATSLSSATSLLGSSATSLPVVASATPLSSSVVTAPSRSANGTASVATSALPQQSTNAAASRAFVGDSTVM